MEVDSKTDLCDSRFSVLGHPISCTIIKGWDMTQCKRDKIVYHAGKNIKDTDEPTQRGIKRGAWTHVGMLLKLFWSQCYNPCNVSLEFGETLNIFLVMVLTCLLWLKSAKREDYYLSKCIQKFLLG